MKNWPENYKAINNFEIIDQEDFKLIPIRYDDRYSIMKWRNEQIYHLRQKKKLSKYDQDKYFEEVVLKQKEDNPDQILFSFFEKNELVAYGGLVHINWGEKEAEVSFVMKTSHEKKILIYIGTIFETFRKYRIKTYQFGHIVHVRL